MAEEKQDRVDCKALLPPDARICEETAPGATKGLGGN